MLTSQICVLGIQYDPLSSTTVFNIDDKKCFLSSKLAEETCDTENWSNDAENSELITEINLKINSHRTFKL